MLVWHIHVKTPTAAAEFLIDRAIVTIDYLMRLQDRLVQTTGSILAEEERQLNSWSKDVYHNSRSFYKQIVAL